MSNDNQLRETQRDKEHPIHFVVDGEPETTEQNVLTAAAIIELAGLDPKTNYLEETAPDKESFKDNSEKEISMKTGMVFKTKPTGPMPVS